VALIVAALCASRAHAQSIPAIYDLEDLGQLPDTLYVTPGFAAQALDDRGALAGWAEAESSSYHAFRRVNGILYDLGLLPGSAPNASSYAYAMNNRGEAVGKAAAADQTFHPALFRGGQAVDLGVLGPGGYEATALGINDAGQVVGGSESGAGVHAFLYQNGTMSDLGTLPGGIHSYAYDINALGHVVGFSMTTTFGGGIAQHAFLYRQGTMMDLGTLPGGSHSSTASAVNAADHVVGSSAGTRAQNQAFLWVDGSMTDLGTFGGNASSASDINDAGVVVGAAEVAPDAYHAFVWADGTLHDLNARIAVAGWELITAMRVNERGQILGVGRFDGTLHSFLLSPSGGGAAAVPDLGALARVVLAVGLAAGALAVLRRLHA
jgi:probable HAF family extracellular repeat protein